MSACSAGSGAPSSSGSGGGNVSFGGAQDIGDFQAILDRGEVPGPDTLDANGFFNTHYNAPPPQTTCTDVLCLTPGVSVGRDWLTGAHQATLQIAVNTNVDPTQYHRLPLDLVAVIDRSGSMSSDGRLDKVKLGLHTMIANLQDGDRLAIVSFSDGSRIDATLGTLDRASLDAIVDSLQPGGGTDIYDGLHDGFQLLADSGSDRQRRVILLSDGQANEGDSYTPDIIAMADSFVETGDGLTTIGVGNDFDIDLMRGLAEHGAGNFYFLDDPAAATEVFSEELDYFMNPLALDVQISATAGGGYTFGEVVGTRLWTAEPTSGTMSVPAVFLASRTGDPTEGKRGGGSMLFIQLIPTGNNGPDGTVANLTLTYKLPNNDGGVITQTVTLAYPNDPSQTPDTPYLSAPEMAPRFAMYNMFLGLRAATQSVDPNCAAAVLFATKTNAHAWLAEHDDQDLVDDVTLVDEYLANLEIAGATATDDSGISSCAQGVDPYNPPVYGGDDYPRYGDGYGPRACSAGGGAGWLAMVGIAGFVARRRRR